MVCVPVLFQMGFKEQVMDHHREAETSDCQHRLHAKWPDGLQIHQFCRIRRDVDRHSSGNHRAVFEESVIAARDRSDLLPLPLFLVSLLRLNRKDYCESSDCWSAITLLVLFSLQSSFTLTMNERFSLDGGYIGELLYSSHWLLLLSHVAQMCGV